MNTRAETAVVTPKNQEVATWRRPVAIGTSRGRLGRSSYRAMRGSSQRTVDRGVVSGSPSGSRSILCPGRARTGRQGSGRRCDGRSRTSHGSRWPKARERLSRYGRSVIASLSGADWAAAALGAGAICLVEKDEHGATGLVEGVRAAASHMTDPQNP